MNLLRAEFTDWKNRLSWLLAIYTVLALLGQCDFSFHLSETSDFIIGEATKYGTDIKIRIGTYYRVLATALVTLVILRFLLKRFVFEGLNELLYRDSKQWLLGINIGLMSLWMVTQSDYFSVNFIHAQLFGLLTLEIYFRVAQGEKQCSQGQLLMNLIFGVGVFSLTRNTYITFLAQLLFFFIQQLTGQFAQRIIGVIGSGVNVFFIVAVELTLILNQRGITTPYYPIIMIIVGLVAILFLLFKLGRKEQGRFIYFYLAPLTIAGLALSSVYSPVISQPTELFELANKLNPLMMMSQHDKLPMVDFISSHLNSDYFWESLYVICNGYSADTAPLIYTGFNHVLAVLLTYGFLISYFGNKPFVFIFTLFSPYLFFLIPPTFASVFVPAICLLLFERTQKKKWLRLASFSLFTLIFWRLDLAVASVSSAIFVFAGLFYLRKNLRKELLLNMGVVSVIGVGIIAFYATRLPEFSKQLLGYFGANQAHGLHQLTYDENNLFWINYYFLPGLIVIAMAVLLYKIKSIQSDGSFWTILFLSGIYFFNLQRGLVRHSFVESQELFISSTGWLILLLIVHHYLLKSKQTNQLLVTFSIAGLVLSIHSADNWKSIFDHSPTFRADQLPDVSSKVNRVLPDQEYLENTYPLIHFLDSNLERDETFLDFSNSSMLYYYSGKKVPSVFVQYLQNTVNEELQEINLKSLNKTKIPYVVFNQLPKTFFDGTDGIPNEVRYRKVTAFIYNNYLPYRQIGMFQVWSSNAGDSIPEFEVMNDHWDLGLIPYYWSEKLKSVKGKQLEPVIKIRPEHLLRLTIESTHPQTAKLIGDEEKVLMLFEVKQGRHAYILPLGSSYHFVSGCQPKVVNQDGLKIVKKELILD